MAEANKIVGKMEIVLLVDIEKQVDDLAELIAQRAYTIDGVSNVYIQETKYFRAETK